MPRIRISGYCRRGQQGAEVGGEPAAQRALRHDAVALAGHPPLEGEERDGDGPDGEHDEGVDHGEDADQAQGLEDLGRRRLRGRHEDRDPPGGCCPRALHGLPQTGCLEKPERPPLGLPEDGNREAGVHPILERRDDQGVHVHAEGLGDGHEKTQREPDNERPVAGLGVLQDVGGCVDEAARRQCQAGGEQAAHENQGRRGEGQRPVLLPEGAEAPAEARGDPGARRGRGRAGTVLSG